MAESHDIRINVDASNAKRELKSFNDSLGEVKKTLGSLGSTSGAGGFDRLATQVDQVTSAFSRLKQVAGVGNIGREIAALSSSINNVRAPSAQVINNINALGSALRALSSIRIDRQFSQDLRAISTSLAVFRVPPPSEVQRLASVLRGLASIRIDPNLARGLAGLGQATASIRAPSATQVRNLQNLIQTLSSGNAAAVASMARALHSVGAVNIRVPTPRISTGPAGRQIQSPVAAGFAGQGHEAARSLHDLEHALGVSHQAATLLRASLGALTLGHFATEIQETGNNLMSFRVALDAVASSSGEVGKGLEFVKRLAAETGSNLEDMIPAYQKLYINMRSVGKSAEEIQEVFAGFQMGLQAMHIPLRDQKLALMELGETFSMNAIHAQQALRAMGSHIPGMGAMLQEALGRVKQLGRAATGAELREAFMSGGLDPTKIWSEVAKILKERFGPQMEETLNHSTAQINIFKNSLTLLRQAIFDGGFDSGLTGFLKTMNEMIASAGIDNIGQTLGEGFRSAFAVLTVFVQKVVEFKNEIGAAIMVAAGFGGLQIAFGLAAGALAKLYQGLVALTELRAAIATFWAVSFAPATTIVLAVVAGLSVLVAAFGNVAEGSKQMIENLRAVWDWLGNIADRALKGAVALTAFAAALWQGKSWDDAKKAGADAMNHVGVDASQKIASGIMDAGRKGFDFIINYAKEAFGGLGLDKAYEEAMKKSTPHVFGGSGAYDENDARYQKMAIDNAKALNEEQKKLYEKLMPTNHALKEYAERLKQINDMKGKEYDGKIISDEDLARLKEVAREDVMQKGFPVANKIQQMMETIKLEREAVANVTAMGFDGTDKEALRQEKEFLQFKFEMKKKHIELTQEEEQALRALIKAQADVTKGESDGFTKWANGVKNGTDSLNDNIKSSMDSLSSGIANIVTHGKGQFKSLGEAIRHELANVFSGMAQRFIKSGIDQLMAGAIKQMNLGSIFGQGKDSVNDALKLGQGALDSVNGKIDAAAEEAMKSMTTANMDVQAGVVNINGANLGGAGSSIPGSSPNVNAPNSAFTTEGINPAAAGGAQIGAPVNPLAAAQIQKVNPQDFQELKEMGFTPSLTPFAGGNGGANSITGGLPTLDGGYLKQIGPNTQIGALPQQAAETIIKPPATPALSDSERLKQAGIVPGGGLPSSGFSLPREATPAEIKSGVPNIPAPPTRPSDLSPGGASVPTPPSRPSDLASDGLPAPVPPGNIPNLDGKPLGFLSAKYEGKVGTVGGDGGRAYGKYQFDYEQGGVQRFLSENPKYAQQFAGMRPGTQEFNAKWKEIARTDPKGFEAAQDATAKAKWYDPAAAHADKLGFKMDDRGIQESIFSGSIQHGGIKKILNQTARRDGFKDMSAKDQINAFYDARTDYVQRHSGLHGDRLQGVLNRYKTERQDALGISGKMSPFKNQSPFAGKAIDSMPTGAISSIKKQTENVAKQFNKTMKDSLKPLQKDLTKNFSDVGKRIADSGGIHKLTDQFQGFGQQAMQGAQSATQLTGQVGDMATQMAQQGVQSVESFSQQIQKLIEQMMSGMGGGGGGIGSLLGGLFSEGGYSTEAVSSTSLPASAWHGAPHFAEGGTTVPGGGIPAVLHQNEAVVPLSRGRAIPVEMKGAGAEGGGGTVNNYHMHTNVQAKDADSFRRSANQVAAQMQQMMGRLAARNN